MKKSIFTSCAKERCGNLAFPPFCSATFAAIYINKKKTCWRWLVFQLGAKTHKIERKAPERLARRRERSVKNLFFSSHAGCAQQPQKYFSPPQLFFGKNPVLWTSAHAGGYSSLWATHIDVSGDCACQASPNMQCDIGPDARPAHKSDIRFLFARALIRFPWKHVQLTDTQYESPRWRWLRNGNLPNKP